MTVDDYLAQLEPDRRAVLEPVVGLVRSAVPPGYEEAVSHGMATWSVPLSRLPKTYNGEPLMYTAVAAQKRHCSVYLMGLYADPESDRSAEFRRRWTASGRRLDLGKSCLRFRTFADLDVDLLRETLGALSVDDYVALYERSRR
jgi:uncharacterized protein YdhG (YjbR/CyaY superfamily)